MTRSMKLALAFLAFGGVSSSPAFAQEDEGPMGDGPRAGMRFERADADNSGDVTFEEFAAAMNNRVGGADANKDGKMTVSEIADQIQRMRAERMARRIIQRFDANGDGELTTAEVESRQKKMFALMDRNDDGKIVADEMPRRQGRHGRRR